VFIDRLILVPFLYRYRRGDRFDNCYRLDLLDRHHGRFDHWRFDNWCHFFNRDF
jgi:hypothetical protein